MPDNPLLDLEITGVAVGGDGVARDGDGRVVFVAGALPGERVRALEVASRARHGRALTVEVIESSPHRIAPPCPAVARGCGGCGWQFVDPAVQPELKVDVVRQALERLGGVAEPIVRTAPPLPAEAYRTTIRVAVDDGVPGFRALHSHDIVDVDSCLVAHPLVDDVLRSGRWGSATEVTIRAGARTGERLVVASPTAAGVEVPPHVQLVGTDELAAGRRARRAWYHEEVDGRRFRISARSFFQSRPDGADQLVALVRDHVGPAVAGGTLLDLFAGVGVFAATVDAERAVAVEWSRSAAADARHNLSGRPATVVATDVERLTRTRADAVVADPSRRGLGRRAVGVIAASRAPIVALVSCDAGALGRDTRLLAAKGYRLVDATVVDLFPGTPHVEVVTRFARTDRPDPGEA